MHAGWDRVCGALIDAVDESNELAEDPLEALMELWSVPVSLLQ
jgi:hypothetical protein